MQSILRRTPVALTVALLSFALTLGASPTAAVAQREERFDGSLAVKRAKTWTSTKVSYSQVGSRGGYRRDCSGFVSMAWDLPVNLVTWRIPLVAKRIRKNDLRAGDVMLDYTSGSKHVILFERWVDAKHTRYVGLEETGQSGVDRAIRRVLPYPYRVNGARYRPWRYVGMDRYWKSIPKSERQRVRGYRGPELTPDQARIRREAAVLHHAEQKAEETRREAQRSEDAARALARKAEVSHRAQPMESVDTHDPGRVIGDIVVTLAERVLQPPAQPMKPARVTVGASVPGKRLVKSQDSASQAE